MVKTGELTLQNLRLDTPDRVALQIDLGRSECEATMHWHGRAETGSGTFSLQADEAGNPLQETGSGQFFVALQSDLQGIFEVEVPARAFKSGQRHIQVEGPMLPQPVISEMRLCTGPDPEADVIWRWPDGREEAEDFGIETGPDGSVLAENHPSGKDCIRIRRAPEQDSLHVLIPKEAAHAIRRIEGAA